MKNLNYKIDYKEKVYEIADILKEMFVFLLKILLGIIYHIIKGFEWVVREIVKIFLDILEQMYLRATKIIAIAILAYILIAFI